MLNALLTPGWSVARTGEATVVLLPPHVTRSRLPTSKANDLEPLTMIARRTIASPLMVKQENPLETYLQFVFGEPKRMQRDIPPHMSRIGKASAMEPTSPESTSYPVVRNPPRPISRWETYDETQPHINEPTRKEGHKSFHRPSMATNHGNNRTEMTEEVMAPANVMWSLGRGKQKRPERHSREGTP